MKTTIFGALMGLFGGLAVFLSISLNWPGWVLFLAWVCFYLYGKSAKKSLNIYLQITLGIVLAILIELVGGFLIGAIGGLGLYVAIFFFIGSLAFLIKIKGLHDLTAWFFGLVVFFVERGSDWQKLFDRGRGLEAVNELKKSGLSNVELITIDVNDLDSIEQARATLECFVKSLDILINNAAIAGGQPQSISKCELMTLRHVFDTNYFGAVQTTQQFIPLLQKSNEPVIVNVSSEVGSLTMQTSQDRNPNWDHFSIYGSSKVALNAFTVTLSNELRDTNFRVFSVTPGYTATDLNQHQGIKTVEEGASTIVKYATSKNPTAPRT